MLKSFSLLEKKLIKRGGFLAIDEAGRGSLAGPLVVAGVIIDKNVKVDFQVNDSKMLSAKQREAIFNILKQKMKYFTSTISAKVIDKQGIIKAEVKAIRRLIKKAKTNLVLIDGLPFKTFKNENFIFVVHGDQRLFSLACASIVAKVYRDRLLKKLSFFYNLWALGKNKGYGTKEHLKLIKKNGLSPIHRRTFIPSHLLKYLEKKNSVF